MFNSKMIGTNNSGGVPEPTNTNFRTVTYTGNGSTQSITGVGFAPDLVWAKAMNYAYNHWIYDTVRGANAGLLPNLTIAENTTTGVLSSLDSDGFTLGSNGELNQNNGSYVAWCLKAGGAAVSNNDGTIPSLVSANVSAGFSIVNYTGTGAAANRLVGHGLGQAPKIIIVKNRTGTQGWLAWTTIIDGSMDYLFLNSAGPKDNAGQSLPTSTVFNIQNDGGGESNASGNQYLAYCFADAEGFSKIGTYSGNASSFNVDLGFEPSLLIIKSTNNSGNWLMFDNKRGSGSYLKANLSDQAFTSAAFDVPFTENGFTIPAPLFTDEQINEPGWEYMYMAFAY